MSYVRNGGIFGDYEQQFCDLSTTLMGHQSQRDPLNTEEMIQVCFYHDVSGCR